MCLVDVVMSLGCAYIYTYMPTVKQLQAGSSGGILQDTNVMTRWQLWAWHHPEGLPALWGAEVGHGDVDKPSSLQPKANMGRRLSYCLYFLVLFPMCPWLAGSLLCIPADSELAVTLPPLLLSTGKYSCAPPHLAGSSFKIWSLISKIIIVK